MLLSCIVLNVFSGCRTIDVTKRVFKELADNPPIIEGEWQEPKKPEDLQYYISEKLILTLRDQPYDYTVTNTGKLIITEWKIRKRVTITKSKYGILQSIDNDGNLVIGFERMHPHSVLKFGQLSKGDDERYYLLHDENYTIDYGDFVYTVDYIDKGFPPYLYIKAKIVPKNDPDIRKAEGWKVHE